MAILHLRDLLSEYFCMYILLYDVMLYEFMLNCSGWQQESKPPGLPTTGGHIGMGMGHGESEYWRRDTQRHQAEREEHGKVIKGRALDAKRGK